MSNIRKTVLFIIIAIAFPQFLFAYIDPGSLNAIWQFLAAILIGLVTAFSFVRIKVKLFLDKLFSKNKTKQSIDDIPKNKTNK